MYAHLGKVKLLLEICQLKPNFHKLQRLNWKLLFRQADHVLAAVTGRYESSNTRRLILLPISPVQSILSDLKNLHNNAVGQDAGPEKTGCSHLTPSFPLGSQTEASSFRFGSHTLYPCWTLIHSGIRVSLQHSWSKRPKKFPDLAREGSPLSDIVSSAGSNFLFLEIFHRYSTYSGTLTCHPIRDSFKSSELRTNCTSHHRFLLLYSLCTQQIILKVQATFHL